MSAAGEQLFSLCDPGARGFVERRDFDRLAPLLALDDAQLDAVFAQLDGDGDGRLTRHELLVGLSARLLLLRSSTVLYVQYSEYSTLILSICSTRQRMQRMI